MRRTLREYGVVIGIAALSAVLFRFLILEAYSIPGPAMKPALLPGDHVLVWKLPYVFLNHQPARGAVVLFSPPEDPEHQYIRRVVGLPGDRVMIEGGSLIVNGRRARIDGSEPPGSWCAKEQLDETTYEACGQQPELADLPETTVAPKTVFLVADQRTRISSLFPAAGVVPVGSLIGEAWWVWLSIVPRADLPTAPGPGEDRPLFSRLRFNRIFRKVGS